MLTVSSPEPWELILVPKGETEAGEKERSAGRASEGRGARAARVVERERRAMRAGEASLEKAVLEASIGVRAERKRERERAAKLWRGAVFWGHRALEYPTSTSV